MLLPDDGYYIADVKIYQIWTRRVVLTFDGMYGLVRKSDYVLTMHRQTRPTRVEPRKSSQLIQFCGQSMHRGPGYSTEQLLEFYEIYFS